MASAGIQGKCNSGTIPAELLRYFNDKYLTQFIVMFPNAAILAAGAKTRDRRKRAKVDYIECSAFTRPECNKPCAKQSWIDAGKATAAKILSTM